MTDKHLCQDNAPPGYWYNHNEGCYQKLPLAQAEEIVAPVHTQTRTNDTLVKTLFEKPDIRARFEALIRNHNLCLTVDEIIAIDKITSHETHLERFFREVRHEHREKLAAQEKGAP